MKLLNKLHEDFAQLIATGSSPSYAYRKLKPTVGRPATLGSRLWNRTDIRIRVSEINEEAITERNLTIQKKLAMLENQIRGELPTKVRVDSRGAKEAVYDMLGALQLHNRLCGESSPLASKGPVLKLDFKVYERDER